MSQSVGRPKCEWYESESEMWACGRAMGQYMGSFPNGFLPRVNDSLGIPIYNETVLFPFGGITPRRSNWVSNDIKQGEPTGPNDEPLPADYGYDARDLPDSWTNRFPIVISDPPYGKHTPKTCMMSSIPNRVRTLPKLAESLNPADTLSC